MSDAPNPTPNPDPAPNPAPAAAPASAATPTDWTSGFSEERKGYVQNKGFKDPSMVLDSYQNLEKLIGVPPDRVLKLPEKDDAPEWGGIWERLGVPKDAKEYKIDVPKEGGDPQFAEMARAMFKEAGLTSKQAETIVKRWNETAVQNSTSRAEAYQAQVNNDITGLKKEWGAAYDQEMRKAKKATVQFGIDGATIDKLEQGMGYGGLMKFLSKIGGAIGEHDFVGGSSGQNFGAMTPAQATAKIAALRQDPGFVKRYTSGDFSAKQEMDNLHRMAYPEA